MANTKKARVSASNRSIAGSVFEGIGTIGSQTAKTAVSEFSTMARDGFNSLTGGVNPQTQESGSPAESLASPEQMQWGRNAKAKEKPRDVEVFSFAERKESMETNEQIKKLVIMIKQEVRKIEGQNKMMITETARISVEQLPDNPGVYHIRFFEWLLAMLRDVRKKVSESASWLSIAQGKQKKKGYWNMAKKKGTSFLLSGERTAATQTG